MLELVALIFYSYRFSLLTQANITNAAYICSIGFAFTNMLPFRMGDVVRISFAKFALETPLEHIIFSVVVEKFFDLAFILFMVVLVAAFSARLDFLQFDAFTLILLFLAVIGIGLLFYAICLKYGLATKTIQLIKKQVLEKIIKNHLFRLKLVLFKVSYLTSSIWLTTVLVTFTFFNSVIPNFTVLDATCITILTVLSIAISSTPMNLGTFEVIVSTYLIEILSVTVNEAIGLALVFHFLAIVPYFIVVPLLTLFWRKT